MSEREEEVAGGLGVTRAAECVRRYIETQPPEVAASTAWKRLAHLYRISDDVIGGCSAFLKASESTDPPLEEISKMANWLNNASAVIGKDRKSTRLNSSPYCAPRMQFSA